MTKTTTALIAAALYLAVPAQADAQSDKARIPESYFNVTVGAQPQQQSFEAKTTSTIFDEEATFTADQTLSNGPFFDVAAGFRVSTHLSIGGTFSFFQGDGDATGTASIPDPLVFDQHTNVPIQGSNLKRNEFGYHLQAVWFVPLSRKLDIAVSAGPSIFHVSQDFLSGSSAEGSTVVTYGVDSQSGTGFGVNAGVDTTYLLTPRYGVGVLIRYTWGKVTIDETDLTLGGFQAGAGLRIRF